MEIGKSEICINCGDRNCCRGLCKEMNEYLIKQQKEENKTANK